MRPPEGRTPGQCEVHRSQVHLRGVRGGPCVDREDPKVDLEREEVTGRNRAVGRLTYRTALSTLHLMKPLASYWTADLCFGAAPRHQGTHSSEAPFAITSALEHESSPNAGCMMVGVDPQRSSDAG